MGNHQRHHDEHPSPKEDRHENEDTTFPFPQSNPRSAVHIRLGFEDRGRSALRLERELKLLGGMQAHSSSPLHRSGVGLILDRGRGPEGTARSARKIPESLSPLVSRKLSFVLIQAMYDWDRLANCTYFGFLVRLVARRGLLTQDCS